MFLLDMTKEKILHLKLLNIQFFRRLKKDGPEVQVHKLDHRSLRDMGLFEREWIVEKRWFLHR
jgi:hypothetical protein